MTAKARILIVEDDPAMQATLRQALQREPYQLFSAATFAEGQALYETEDPDVVLLDINLPDRSGRELFDWIIRQDEEAVVVMLTAFPDLRGAIALMKAGAFDYLVKPFDLTELRLTIGKGLELRALKDEVLRLKRRERDREQPPELVGESRATWLLREDIRRIAEAETGTVLISGESGTGKELVATAIHTRSGRHRAPLVAINCSAIPENLVESELFGHEKGAFTHAERTAKGAFELAHQGTLFLDEVAELPPAVQPKLLRALETRRIRRLGGAREIPIDIRLVSATNRNLAEAVAKGEFREDLYYRINVIPLEIPPLRERVEDIRPLLEHSVRELARVTGQPALEFTPAAVRVLERYSWPGNVREMRNLVERLMILRGPRAGRSVIGVAQLPGDVRAVQRGSRDAADVPASCTLDEVERNHIRAVLERSGGNKSQTSRTLGISRNTLKGKLKRYGLED